jgi:hypothetical protein
MQGEELPDYKRKFLSEMEQLKQEQEEAERPVNKALRDEPKKYNSMMIMLDNSSPVRTTS